MLLGTQLYEYLLSLKKGGGSISINQSIKKKKTMTHESLKAYISSSTDTKKKLIFKRIWYSAISFQ
jgi:hypothetical protein